MPERTFQNTANTQFKDFYLDIDGHNGKLMLSDRQASGARWELTNRGENVITLQNTASSPFKDFFLDIDGNTGELILMDGQASGAFWKVIDHGNCVVTLQNTANSPFKNFYLDIDGHNGNLMLSERQASGTFWNLSDGRISILPINLEREDKIGDGFHMRTKVSISNTARLDAFVETWTTNILLGFTGQVVVFLLDQDQNILWNTQDTHRFGINAPPPFQNRNSRSDHFSEDIPDNILKRVRKIAIYHRHDPKTIIEIMNDLAEIIEEFDATYKKFKNTEIVNDIATAIATSEVFA